MGLEKEKEKQSPTFFEKLKAKIIEGLAALKKLSKEITPAPYGMNQLPDQPDWYPRNLHITIDDGPNLNYLPDILDTLATFKVKATFFFTGSSLKPGLKPLLQRLIEEGHHIGYHCYWHCHSEEAAKKLAPCKGKTFGELSRSKIQNDIQKFNDALDEALGYHYKLTLGRPPGGSGKHRKALKKAFQNKGLQGPKLWHFDDMKKHKDTTLSKLGWITKDPKRLQNFAQKIRENPRDFILLIHEKPKRAEYLHKLLETLKKQATKPSPNPSS